MLNSHCRSDQLDRPDLQNSPIMLSSHCRSDQLDRPDLQNSPIMLSSHCRSDQPDRPDLPNSTTKPEFVYTASSRPLLDHTRPHTVIDDSCSMSTRQLLRSLLDHPDRYKIPTRSLVDQLDRCSISTRPLPDQIVMVVY